MKNLSIEEIKEKFEHRDYFIREEFINQYHFKDTYYDYYRGFIINFNYKSRNHNYVSDIIDLANDLSIYDITLYYQYLVYLKEKFHVVVKLSILYYVIDRNDLIPDNGLEEKLTAILDERIHIILKNQLLCSLYKLTGKDHYFNLLIESLTKTHDSRSFIRILSNNENIPNDIEKKQILVNKIRLIHEKENLGKGITELLQTF
jgi:hypothetical protein